MKAKNFFAKILVVAMSFGASQATLAQEIQPGIFKVAKGASQKIDRFGVCKVIKNGGANPIMVPAGSREQWSVGNGSFHTNGQNMPGVTMADCGPRLDNECFFWASAVGSAGVTNYT